MNYILPRNPREISFEENVLIVKKKSGGGEEKFSIQHKTAICLNLTKNSREDYSTVAGIVNRECEKFELKEFIPDMFKCLIFVQGLMAPEDDKIRTRILSKFKQNPKNNPQMVVKE